MPKDRLRGVTLGVSMKDQQIETLLLKICGDGKPPIPVLGPA